MTFHPRNMFLAAALLAFPLTGALAQGSNPAGNLGSNKSATAAPGTADSKSMSGLNTGDANAQKTMPGAAAADPHTPGGTGKVVVPGANSSVAKDRAATVDTKTGVVGTAGGR